jgi:hypothetical protein
MKHVLFAGKISETIIDKYYFQLKAILYKLKKENENDI